jgi:hypothetical protein
MNPMEAASPPLILSDPRRARLRARPSALKGRFAIAARRTCGPPLTAEPLRPLIEQRHGQHQRAARPNARRSSESLQIKSLRFRGIATGQTYCSVRM